VCRKCYHLSSVAGRQLRNHPCNWELKAVAYLAIELICWPILCISEMNLKPDEKLTTKSNTFLSGSGVILSSHSIQNIFRMNNKNTWNSCNRPRLKVKVEYFTILTATRYSNPPRRFFKVNFVVLKCGAPPEFLK